MLYAGPLPDAWGTSGASFYKQLNLNNNQLQGTECALQKRTT